MALERGWQAAEKALREAEAKQAKFFGAGGGIRRRMLRRRRETDERSETVLGIFNIMRY